MKKKKRKYHQSYTNILHWKEGKKQEKANKDILQIKTIQQKNNLLEQINWDQIFHQKFKTQLSNTLYGERIWKRYLRLHGRHHESVGRDKM